MKKKLFRVAVVRRAVSRIACMAFIVAAGFTAQAQTAQVKQEISNPLASVTYMGSRQDILSVAVKYTNAPGAPFTVTVRDQDGYQLFEGSFTERKFDKIFQLPKPDISKLVFTIRNTRTSEVQSFEVNTKAMEETLAQRPG